MGGKGGGGGGGVGGGPSDQVALRYKDHRDDNYIMTGFASDLASGAYGDDKVAMPMTEYMANGKKWKADPAPAAAPAAAPAPEAPAPAAPAPEAPAPAEPVAAPANPISSGGAIDAPAGTTGDTLGGAIKNPPSYWTGNINNFKGGSSSKKDSMTTTQT